MRTLCLLLLLAVAACSSSIPPTPPPQPGPDACMGNEKDGGVGGTGQGEALCPDNAD